MPPVDVPTVIHIGTINAYKGNYPYVYIWEPTSGIFICDQTTSDGFPDEKLVIEIEVSDRARWFVAVEGSLSHGVFAGRRPAFRSQDAFWTVGWHSWQVNRNNDGGQPDWDSSQMSAETKVPAGTATAELNISD
jgi:hypothetical protein